GPCQRRRPRVSSCAAHNEVRQRPSLDTVAVGAGSVGSKQPPAMPGSLAPARPFAQNPRPAPIAPLVEPVIRNDGVGGWIPSRGTSYFKHLRQDPPVLAPARDTLGTHRAMLFVVAAAANKADARASAVS